MPRRDFIADLKKAQAESELPQNIISISPGQDDGNILLLILCPPPGSYKLRLQVQISDVGDYPWSHSFFVFSDSEDIPEDVALALSKIPLLEKLSISEAIAKISAVLNGADDQMVQDDIDDSADISDEDIHNDDEDGFQYHDEERDDPFHSHNSDKKIDQAVLDQLKADLRTAKRAGFRVSHAGAILEQDALLFLMISVRTSKLNIPQNALEAWNLQPSDYIMLLLKYRCGYCSFEKLHSHGPSTNDVEMFILVTKHHKLTRPEISQAISREKKNRNTSEISEQVSDDSRSVRPLFIGSALEELLNKRLLILLGHRLELRTNWDGAMKYYNDMQGVFSFEATATSKYYAEQDTSKIENLPLLLQVDHFHETPFQHMAALSFPCIAMQFALRHIVRCTQFCLVCFDKTNDNFEALKPYVCSKPLCLFQYMSMGFGPAIEFEILSQKYVVDLLISFCYVTTESCKLKTLPIGLGLMVPNPDLIFGPHNPTTIPMLPLNPPELGSSTGSTSPHEDMLFGLWNSKTRDIVLPELSENGPKDSGKKKTLNVGEQIAFWSIDRCLHHCNVIGANRTTYHCANIVQSNVPLDYTTNTSGAAPKFASGSNIDLVPVTIVPYRKLFDSMNLSAQHVAIRAMLDTLPSVEDMATYLQTTHGSMQNKLSEWKERMVPSALGILRWIIASNRSCIIQEKNSERLVHGMPGYFQFRFASGAPDKETRFANCVKEVNNRLGNHCSTLFAWHGSPIENWHSIVREGLNFNKIVHGRTYGNGVYHALQVDVSIGYSSSRSSLPQSWPSSKLCIQTALSLNEIVNAPDEFRSKFPYLVVQHVDWIQTRYLFVKCSNDKMMHNFEQRPLHVMDLDSTIHPTGDKSAPLLIPDHSKDLVRGDKQIFSSYNAQTPASFGYSDGNEIEMSDESDADDVVLYADEQSLPEHKKDWNCTSFEPGSLLRSSLPTLASPAYATPLSSKVLQGALKLLLQEQQETPLHELGWYLDPSHIDNIYHWIVELHSFDLNLPLAKDLQDQGIQSIVLEIRFGPNFNFSPPFIRVVRPRFLEFAMGGGGHVTAGGALCMQLLTSDGWNPSSTMSAVLLQVRMAITSTDPKPARLLRGPGTNEYNPYEAAEAYRRACRAHGWKVPDDLASIIAMTPPVGSSSPSIIPQKRSAMNL